MMKLKKGFAVAMAAGVLTTGGLGVQATVFSATAFAQVGGGPGAEVTPLDQTPTVDDNALAAGASALGEAAIPESVTLYIHKFGNDGDSPQIGKNNRGLELSEGTVNGTGGAKGLGTKLEATFEVKKITGIDLTKNDGWQKAQALSEVFANRTGDKLDATVAENAIKNAAHGSGPAYAFSSAAKEHGDITTTAGVGSADFKPGLYLVTEKVAPAGYKKSVAPFVVALPMTNPKAPTKWLDKVHVYPKNIKQDTAEPTKTVKDAGVSAFLAGEKVEYKISQAIVDGDKYTKFILGDYYPTNKLETPKLVDVKVMDVTNPQAPAEVETLQVGDYDTTSLTDAAAGRFVIKLTQDGLDKLNNTYLKVENRAVVATLKMTVKTNADETLIGEVENKFKTIIDRENQPPKDPKPNDPNDPNDPEKPPADPTPGTPGNPDPFPKSYYGNVDIVKKGGNERIEGAKFDLYKCTATFDTTKTPHELTGYTLDKKDANKLKADIEADKDGGKAEIKGLLANDWRDGKSTANADGDITSAYCLVETEAPAGYELLPEHVGFQVKKDEVNAIIPTGDIVNVDENGGFDLPLTGGKGVFALLLAGAAFLVLGRGYSVYAGRRKDA